MSGTAIEKDTFDAESYSDSQFAKWPTDSRFDNVEMRRFKADSKIDEGVAQFSCMRELGRNYYMMHQASLEAKLKMTKANGDVLVKDTDNVGPANNILHTLFDSVTVTLEEVAVNPAPGNYPYKAYIMSRLGYGVEATDSWLQCQGYYKDTSKRFDDTENLNGGLCLRRCARIKWPGTAFRPLGCADTNLRANK